MYPPRPKLTRRKGACKLCRRRRIRCNGANPCSQCERSSFLCEYVHTDHTRRQHQKKLAQRWQQDRLTGDMIPLLSSQNDPPETVVNPVKRILGATAASTADACFLLPTPESTPPFLDLSLYEMKQDYHLVNHREQSRNCGVENDTPTLSFLTESCDTSPLPNNTIWPEKFVEIQTHHSSSISVWETLNTRIADEKTNTDSFAGPTAHRINQFFREARITGPQQQATLGKIKSVLSLEHQLCLPSLLRQAGYDGESHGIDLYSLPMKRLVKRAFQEPFGLAMFSREEDVLRVQERFVECDSPPIDISDLSVLIVSLTWGALVDPHEGDLSTLVALMDTIPVLSKRLLQQNNTVRKFLALVAIISLTEKIGSHDLPALIFDATLIASALGIHSEDVLHYSCVGSEQMQVKQAMWVLYCIDKASALKWQTFPIVREDSLPTANLPKDEFQTDNAPVQHSGWLKIRIQYSKICLKVTQLWQSVKKPLPKDLSPVIVKLSTALGEWYDSVKTDLRISFLDTAAAGRFRHQIFCSYQEALVQLGVISLSCCSSSPTVAQCQRLQDLSKRSIGEVILFSSTLSFGDLLQTCHLIRLNILAVCLLSFHVATGLDNDYDLLDQALLSIVCGLFARIQLALPSTSIFAEVSGLVNFLLQ